MEKEIILPLLHLKVKHLYSVTMSSVHQWKQFNFELNNKQSSVFWVMGKRSLLTSFWPTMSSNSLASFMYIFFKCLFFMDGNKSKPHSRMFFLIGGNKSVFIHQMTKRRSQVFLMQPFFSNGVCIFSTLISYSFFFCLLVSFQESQRSHSTRVVSPNQTIPFRCCK